MEDLFEMDKLLSDPVISNFYEKYIKLKQESVELGLNVFTLVSDLYYRENFHSDVIVAILNAGSKRGERNLCLDLFIDMINAKIGNKICKSDYVDAEIIREHHRIDILIKSPKHCIIIENKMNNAGDMPNQLPRYYKKMRDEGFEVDAIVYLPLNKTKSLDEFSWDDSIDKKIIEEVKERYVFLPAYDSDEKNINLVSNWLEPLILQTSNIDLISLLKQYIKLIKHLTPQTNMEATLSKLYEHILEDETRVNQTKKLIALMNDLDKTLASRLLDRIGRLPYHLRTYQWTNQENNCVFDFKVDGKYSQIFIYTYLNDKNAYEVFIRDKYDWVTDEICKTFLPQPNGSFKQVFAFGEEEKVLQTLDDLLNKIGVD